MGSHGPDRALILICAIIGPLPDAYVVAAQKKTIMNRMGNIIAMIVEMLDSRLTQVATAESGGLHRQSQTMTASIQTSSPLTPNSAFTSSDSAYKKFRIMLES